MMSFFFSLVLGEVWTFPKSNWASFLGFFQDPFQNFFDDLCIIRDIFDFFTKNISVTEKNPKKSKIGHFFNVDFVTIGLRKKFDKNLKKWPKNAKNVTFFGIFYYFSVFSRKKVPKNAKIPSATPFAENGKIHFKKLRKLSKIVIFRCF